MIINGCTAIVTGSTGGLGSTLTLSLAKAGCSCICHYHSNQRRGQELVKEIQQLGRKAAAVRASLDSTENIRKMFAEIEQVCKQADMELPRILVNSAAVFKRQPLAEVTFENGQEVIGLNLIAPIVVSNHFAQMADKNKPHGQPVGHPTAKIVNIVDVGGIKPWAEYSVYCSSKAGLIGAMKSLAKELAPRMCVNAIAPGIFSWPKDFDEAAKKRQLGFIPMGRIGTKDEIAAALLFLLENDYVTGQVLSVDGGRGI